MCHQVQRSRLGAEDCRRRDRRQHSRQPGTSGPRTFRPTRSFRPPMTSTSPGMPTLGLARTPSRTFRRPEPLACPDLPAPGCQHSSTAPTLWLGRTLPGTSGAWNFWPSPELPALPARSHLGRGPCTLSPQKLYILFSYLRFRVSIVIAHLR